MEDSSQNATLKLLIGGVGAAAALVTGYIYFGNNNKAAEVTKTANSEVSSDKKDSTDTNLKASSKDTSTVFSDTQKKEIQEIFVEYVKENNDKFMSAIQEGMQKQQIKAAEEMVKTATAIKEDLAKESIQVGDNKASLKVFAFIDPSCPHCHTLIKTASAVLGKTKNVQFNFLVAAMLGPDSEVLAKAVYAARLQNAEKAGVFLQKMVELPRGASKAQIVLAAKDAGLDVEKFEKDRASNEALTPVGTVGTYVNKLNVPGFPTVFLHNTDNTLIPGQPVSPDEFVMLGERAKDGHDLTKPAPGNYKPSNVPEIKKDETEKSKEKEETKPSEPKDKKIKDDKKK